MLHIITLHYTLLQSFAEVNQFIEGLKLNGILEYMRQNSYEAKKLFIDFRGRTLPSFGSIICQAWKQQKRVGREGVFFKLLFYHRYLEDVNDAWCIRQIYGYLISS